MVCARPFHFFNHGEFCDATILHFPARNRPFLGCRIWRASGFGQAAATSAWLLTILLAALYLAGSYNNSLVRSENSWIIAVSKINNSLHDNLTKLHPKFPYGAKIVVIGIDEQEPRRIGVRALYRRPDLQIFLNGQGVQELRDGDHITLSKLPGFDYHNTYIFLVEETSLREFDLKPNSPENIIAVLQIKPK